MPPGRRRVTRALVTAVPVVVPLTMRLVFPALVRRLGARRGYLAGFAVYWAQVIELLDDRFQRKRVFPDADSALSIDP